MRGSGGERRGAIYWGGRDGVNEDEGNGVKERGGMRLIAVEDAT